MEMIKIDFKYLLMIPLVFIGGISFAGVYLEPEDKIWSAKVITLNQSVSEQTFR